MDERLQKVLARAGLGSRRACEELIAQGRVTVNGQPAQLGQKADPSHDQILLDGQPVSRPEKLTYVMLYKPRGVVSSLASQGERLTVRDLVNLEVRLYPVGRLDVDSEGLILLTNDGQLADFLTHPRYESEKEYRVLVKGEPDTARLQAWSRGVVLEGQRTARAEVVRQERAPTGTWLRIVMHEGRKHQIRDIGLLLGLPVQRLIRVRMGALRLANLQPGEWRTLKPDEVAQLRASGVAAAPPRPPQPRKRSQNPARKMVKPGSRTDAAVRGSHTSKLAPDGMRPAASRGNPRSQHGDGSRTGTVAPGSRTGTVAPGSRTGARRPPKNSTKRARKR